MRNLCKVYFWLLVLLVVITHLFDPPDFSLYEVFDYTNIIVGVTMYLGVFGYAYNVAIFRQKVWRVFLPFIVFWHFLGMYKIIEQANPEILTLEAFGYILVVYLLFFVPGYAAIFFYSFIGGKNGQVWDT